jgi:hypothetical protein
MCNRMICTAIRAVGKADRRPTLQSVRVVRSRDLRLALNSKPAGRAIVLAHPRPLARPRAGRGRRKLPAARLLPEGCGRAWLGGVEGQAAPPRYSAWCAGLRTLWRSARLCKR